jgi:hypothetical protein
MLKKTFILLSILFIASCAQVTSLNLKKHQFGQIPTKIVWIQVAGLNEEHLAIIKFSKQSNQYKTSFEDFLCIGKAWDYNLFKIRPEAYASFHGQLTGKKNIKNTCDDYQLDPIWKYMNKQGYKAGAFEGEMQTKDSLLSAKSCSELGNNFLEGLTLWKMTKRSNSKQKLFHINENTDYKPSQVYFDKSCLTGECYSTFSQNAINMFEQFTRKSGNYIYIIRDFNFLNTLNKKSLKESKADLLELEKIVSYFQSLVSKRNDMLVLVTTAENRNVEFPRAGKEWENFENNGKFFQNKKSQLISTVFASGARAENFCGVYDQSNILSRIFSGAKQQGLEFSIINPFEQ